MLGRPLAADYPAPFEVYISKVPEDDIFEVLEAQSAELRATFAALPAAAGHFRYAPGKWTLHELLGHVIDTERVMAYRALCFARGEQGGLPAFDENLYVEAANFEERTVADLLEEFDLVRQSNLALFRHLAPAAWQRKGTANNRTISVRALAYMLAGHFRHHLGVVRERYLTALAG